MGSDLSLPSMGADPNTITVYGFSCGSYMATNLNVVFSDTFKGAGLISGGPYMAEKYYPFGGLSTPLNEYDRNAETLAPKIIADAIENNADGLIDPLSNLSNMPIYIMSNKEDTTVPPQMHNAQRLFYENFGANIEFVETESRHVWPVDIPEAWGEEFGMPLKEDCLERGGRTIYNCGYDSAGIMLAHTLSNIDGTTL
jgi:predicted esterase